MPVEIVDIRPSSLQGTSVFDLSQDLLKGLSRPIGEKSLPTMLLYDEEGLRLYDAITTSAPEYYPFTAEEEILKNHSEEIVTIMRSQTKHGISCPQVVLELGSGSLRKTSHILKSLACFAEAAVGDSPISYWALDLEKRELERTLNGIVTSDLGQKLEGRVNTKGIWGTYEDGIRFIKDGGLIPGYTAESTGGQTQLHIMFLGSSLGNFPRKEAGPFLRSLPLRAGACDTLLLGLDHDNDVDKIEVAYNDPQGYTRRFKMNALRHAGRVLGDEQFFREDDWEYVNFYDPAGRQHESYYRVNRTYSAYSPTLRTMFDFVENEMIKIEESVKYSDDDAAKLFADANLAPLKRWTDSLGQYSLWLLGRPAIEHI